MQKNILKLKKEPTEITIFGRFNFEGERMIKAVFFDIDGTLVSFQTHRVPPSAAQAILRLREKGIKVFIATGRHLQFIDNLGELEFDGYITLNGSCCYVGPEKRVIYLNKIPDVAVRRLVQFEQEVESFPCIFVRRQGMFINYIDEQVKEVLRLLNFPTPPVGKLEEAFREDVLQLIAFFKAEQEKQIMSEALPGCEATRWNPLFSDIVPAGGSKRVGMEKILDYFHLRREECMALGDGGNDIPMIQYAGIGVAMGNAGEAIQQQADYVTTSVDEDGVAIALKHFNLI